MSLKREMLEAMNLSDEEKEMIIAGHTETVDGLKADIDGLKAELAAAEEKAANLEAVQKELDDTKAALAEVETYKAKYVQVQADFDAYKAAAEQEKADQEKRELYRALLLNMGIDEARVDAIIKITDFTDKIIENGAFANEAELVENAKAIYIGATETRGADVATPPENAGSTLTAEEIDAIKDDTERIRAIAENHELFGF